MNVEEQLHFDGGEMLMVHDVFRREFALMPALVRGVAVGDHNRAQIVTDHIERGAGFGQPRRSPLLAATIGQCSEMKALGIAAAAAIALAPFWVVATAPGVAQAAPFAGVGADPKGCQFLVAQYRISTEPTLPEPAPTTVTPAQTPQVVPPSRPADRPEDAVVYRRIDDCAIG